jgi:hypothetical protein
MQESKQPTGRVLVPRNVKYQVEAPDRRHVVKVCTKIRTTPSPSLLPQLTNPQKLQMPVLSFGPPAKRMETESEKRAKPSLTDFQLSHYTGRIAIAVATILRSFFHQLGFCTQVRSTM